MFEIRYGSDLLSCHARELRDIQEGCCEGDYHRSNQDGNDKEIAELIHHLLFVFCFFFLPFSFFITVIDE